MVTFWRRGQDLDKAACANCVALTGVVSCVCSGYSCELFSVVVIAVVSAERCDTCSMRSMFDTWSSTIDPSDG